MSTRKFSRVQFNVMATVRVGDRQFQGVNRDDVPDKALPSVVHRWCRDHKNSDIYQAAMLRQTMPLKISSAPLKDNTAGTFYKFRRWLLT